MRTAVATAVAWPLLAALLLGLLLRHILLVVARRASAHAEKHTFARVVRVIAAPAALALPLLFLALAVASAPLSGKTIATLQHWLGIGVLLCAMWLVVRAVDALQARILREHPVDIEDNLAARRIQTQTRVIARVIQGAVILVGMALALMTFPAIRQIGTTLLASAGIIGLVAGLPHADGRSPRGTAVHLRRRRSGARSAGRTASGTRTGTGRVGHHVARRRGRARRNHRGRHRRRALRTNAGA